MVQIAHYFRIFLCIFFVFLFGIACTPRIPVTVVGNVSPLPLGLMWTAIPGPEMTRHDLPAVGRIVDELAPLLAEYGWTYKALPVDVGTVDVVVLVSWNVEVSGTYVSVVVPLTPDDPQWGLYPGMSFGEPYMRISVPVEERKYVETYEQSLTLKALPSEGMWDILSIYALTLPESPAQIAWSLPKTELLWDVTATLFGKDSDISFHLQELATSAISRIGRNAKIDMQHER